MKPVGNYSGELVFGNLVTRRRLHQAQLEPHRSRRLEPPAARTSSVSLAAKCNEPIKKLFFFFFRHVYRTFKV